MSILNVKKLGKLLGIFHELRNAKRKMRGSAIMLIKKLRGRGKGLSGRERRNIKLLLWLQNLSPFPERLK